jgi:hypothetical protein
VLAYAVKVLSYSNGRYHTSSSYAMDSVYTDSNGNFSMTFNRDSFGCTYYLSSPAGTSETTLSFPAGDSTWMPLNLYKNVSVGLRMPLQHSDSCWLFLYRNDTVGQWLQAAWGLDTLYEPMSFYKDSSYRLAIKCVKNHVTTAHTYTFYISSYGDTATRYLPVDPTTF